MLIIDINEINQDETLFPVNPRKFMEKIKECCAEKRHKLEFEWIPAVANILANMKNTWEKFVPLTQHEDTGLIQRFFESIASLMSKQLRELVLRSVLHLKDYLLSFQVKIIA